MIQAQGLKLAFGEQTVFDAISFIINGNERIGLVGRNGAGKTTLLKVISGLQYPDDGSVISKPSFSVAYLPQEVVLFSQLSVLTEALNVFKGLGNRLNEVDRLEKMLREKHSEEEGLHLGKALVALQYELNEEESSARIQETRDVLRGLGFTTELQTKGVNELSVGWKMRLVLAKLLLSKADFYLFDEPTNHLDLAAQDWLFEFLLRSKSGFILVSHNRYFLDRLCTTTFELSMGKLTIYKGNYSFYLEQKAARQAALEKQYLEQQKFIQKQTAVIERFRASASKASTVQSMIKSLEKLDLIKLEPAPKSVVFHFPPTLSPGKEVLSVHDVRVAFGEKVILDHISFEIRRGEKVALVAPNGTGKSTLLSLLMGKIPLEQGKVVFGHNVKPAFFEQDQNKSLDPRVTVLDTALDVCKTSEERQRVRAFLGSFLFSGDEVNKKIEVLSGGEKNRVAMVRVLLQHANFLLLDEPTNHLDMQSKEILLSSLQQYGGTLLFVSHDRDFLNRLATKVIELTPQHAWQYQGNYDEYLYAKSKLSSDKIDQRPVPISDHQGQGVAQSPKTGAETHAKRKKVRSLELQIERLEKEKELLLERFSSIAYGSEDYYRACDLLKDIEHKLVGYAAEWELLFKDM